MEARDLALSLAGGRIAIGVMSLLAPGLVGRTMTGPDGATGGTLLFARMVGARDLGLGLGVLVPWTAARPCAAGSKRQPSWTASTRARACSPAATSAQACFQRPSGWRPPERCSAVGCRGSSTHHRLPRQDSDRLFLESSQPGLFGAGDVRHGSTKRLASAVGEGAMSIALVYSYLATLDGDRQMEPATSDAEVTRQGTRRYSSP